MVISSHAAVCPHCGARSTRTSYLMWISIVIALVFLGYTIQSAHDPVNQEKVISRDVINACWNDYANKSLDKTTKNFIADTCNKLEADFRSKYNEAP
ncbi:hypothetical protein LG200_01965 [Methylobacillus caricis]|uniref:hypothetical protein n=1 Tax=Methylobacillus caricis TaxID=1971611 RepID=UPI001CFF81B0|nr:hypothetical protein [Methylobacillus caricis]MCB5186767.1 hypothetical protein [Methylobacillus caricis]